MIPKRIEYELYVMMVLIAHANYLVILWIVVKPRTYEGFIRLDSQTVFWCICVGESHIEIFVQSFSVKKSNRCSKMWTPDLPILYAIDVEGRSPARYKISSKEGPPNLSTKKHKSLSSWSTLALYTPAIARCTSPQCTLYFYGSWKQCLLVKLVY